MPNACQKRIPLHDFHWQVFFNAKDKRQRDLYAIMPRNANMLSTSWSPDSTSRTLLRNFFFANYHTNLYSRVLLSFEHFFHQFFIKERKGGHMSMWVRLDATIWM
ncbi:hypothetical protein VIGAN_08273800 [Vigna angularis var. angularis]|uniref:Uncharacterized protein n=1 Tax=Vigna angularis var. angularis TaxID=157739 RepID=A0A0S3SSQ8_PHAAN|nr:hypothetical protein VIGAN_08273800 [Vigna angularis var. angularis]